MWYTSAIDFFFPPCQRKNINILEPAAPVMAYRERWALVLVTEWMTL